MFIANKLRKENIAEYLLYMWQVEDIIRANQWDIEKIKTNVINQFEVSSEQKQELIQWYEELIDMMYHENVKERGHLQINNNVIIQLSDLHNLLIASPKYPFYNAKYFKTLPFIVELQNKGAVKKSEVETCFDSLYLVLMMRLQKKNLLKETEKAMEHISQLIALLADFYVKQQRGELELD
ncbi:MAG: DUF4924 family protein [Bacteroides sp.]|nr:DUF4924 family protein [Bacteroides sp.]MDD4055306.1 DUF4924 family protein [Bacteroides sp.]MDD4720020.1 DUF4924 family protein [Bacteroides sp.]NLI63209.1 DUF4924 family protein [Bacteroidales bacterium]